MGSEEILYKITSNTRNNEKSWLLEAQTSQEGLGCFASYVHQNPR